MKRKRIRIESSHLRPFTLFLLCVMVMLACGGAVQQPVDPSPARAEAVAIDRFTVDIARLAHRLRPMAQKDAEDQLRDWAVYGTLAHLGVDRDTLGKATFKTAPLRLPYLDDVIAFDYGRGRRAILSEKRVLLLYDDDDPDPAATLGRMADKVRMEMGAIPESFDIYSIKPDPGAGEIGISQWPSVAGTRMFGPDYGYVEHKVKSLEDFKRFIGAIDDVTHVKVGDDGALTLGGRRMPRSRTRGVTVQDVAAIYKAVQVLSGQSKENEKRVAEITAAAQAELDAEIERRKSSLGPEAIDQLISQIAAKYFLYSSSDPVVVQKAKVELENEIKRRKKSLEPEEIEELKNRVLQKREGEYFRAGYSPGAAGFSLDPQWQPRGLPETLELIASDPCRMIDIVERDTASVRKTAPDALDNLTAMQQDLLSALARVQQYAGGRNQLCDSFRQSYGPAFAKLAEDVRSAITEQDPAFRAWRVEHAMQPLWQLERSRTDLADILGIPSISSQKILLEGFSRLVQARHRIQCARYDGPLAGTRVGMNLFYTDLLAKLWHSVDRHHSAPTASVAGFISKPRMHRDPAWADEVRKLPNTRIWFGPKREGYALDQTGQEMWLDFIAARVFAAGSDPANPGAEEMPSEPSRKSIGWWNRHFRDVADYEQEYHVLNQIMKWSVIAAAQPGKLAFLDHLPIDTRYQFDQWYAQAKSDLRYQHPVELRPKHDWVSGTECIDLLVSYTFGNGQLISGGVGLGNGKTIEEAPRITYDAPAALRQVRHGEAGGPGTAGMGAQPHYDEPGHSLAKVGQTTRMRAGAVEMKAGDVEVRYDGGSNDPTTIELTTKAGKIGALHVERPAKDRVSLDFEPAAVERARDSVQRAAARAEGKPIHPSGAAEAGRRIELDGNDGALVVGEPSEAAHWVKSGRPGSQVDADVRVTLEGAEVGARGMDPRAAEQLLDGYPWQQVERQPGAPGVRRTFTQRGPPLGSRPIRLTGIEGAPDGLELYVTRDGRLYLPRPESDASRALWRNGDDFIQNELTQSDLTKIQTDAFNGVRTIDRRTLSDPSIPRSIRAAERGDLKAARALLAGPDSKKLDPSKKAELRDEALRRSDAHLAQGEGLEAGSLAQFAGEVAGNDKTTEIRHALADIQAGLPKRVLNRSADQVALAKALDGVPINIRERPELAEFLDVLDARRDPSTPTILGIPAGELYAEADGVEMRSVLKLKRPLEGEVLTMPQRSQIANDNATVLDNYEVLINDRVSLNRHDSEAAASTIAEVAKLPNVKFRALRGAKKGYSPEAATAPSKGGGAEAVTGAGKGRRFKGPVVPGIIETQSGNKFRRVRAGRAAAGQGILLITLCEDEKEKKCDEKTPDGKCKEPQSSKGEESEVRKAACW